PARLEVLKKEHVPCSAGETPAIQSYPSGGCFMSSEQFSCKLQTIFYHVELHQLSQPTMKA
ncbi:MAG: hypothetical protein WC944_07375, partial [Candidatus Cloacimonadaceae bacterium]